MTTSVVFYSEFMVAASQLKRTRPGVRGVYENYPMNPPMQLPKDLLKAVQAHLEDGQPLEVTFDDSLSHNDYDDYLKAAGELAKGEYFDFTAPSGIMVNPRPGTEDPSKEALLQTEQYLRGGPMKITLP